VTFEILQGDALTTLRTLPDASVHCCITSPPYYGLRDYGVEGQIGLERTPEEYIARLVGVFREVRRVLKDDGTCWINCGDSYNAQPGQRKTTDKAGLKQGTSVGSVGAPSRCVDGLKPKDLIGIPWMLAFALRADGWYLRQDIIWAKPNPMPESVKDRCTKSHEYVFLLSKSAKYWYDAEAVAEDAAYPGDNRAERTDTRKLVDPMCIDGGSRARTGNPTGLTRNRRSVWTLSTLPTPEAHFATFPIELPETCLLAGCPEGGTVLDPFTGAGTTGLACLKNNRRFLGIELSAPYVEIAMQRARKYYPLLLEARA
jgi:DNA modification methylase